MCIRRPVFRPMQESLQVVMLEDVSAVNPEKGAFEKVRKAQSLFCNKKGPLRTGRRGLTQKETYTAPPRDSVC